MIFNLLALLTVVNLLADTVAAAQGVEYRIEASLDESTDVLTGRAELRYTNNSAVPLDTLWFHQHLNAFRPNSAWARRELESGIRRFQDLSEDQQAFERIQRVEIDGMYVSPVYPGAPDSTVVAVPLPRPLPPGATGVIRLDWVARLATTPRRQGRQGRHYDWAHWYPRIAAFDGDGWQVQPLLPQGEFFGEFGSYDVTLDLEIDQVVGATGVPVEGDPGWVRAPGGAADDLLYQRDAYPPVAPRTLGLLRPAAESGRKHIRWRAEDVHHFGWNANPDFMYEGGRVTRPGGGEIAIHVLHWPSDTDWANGVALGRTITALEWLQNLFGAYPWPQLTNVHRIEPGGTEFPMLVMNGSPSEGLIMHEAVHQYLHGILANNEFREAWLDEGFTSYLTNRYFEQLGRSDVWTRSLQAARERERLGRTEPIGLAAAEFRDFATYQAMSYTKAELVFRMLEWLIGKERMDAVLRTLFERHALQHVDEQDLRRAVTDVTGDNLDWFFEQWIHTTNTLDYSVAAAASRQLADGRWATTVEVLRSGEAWMPVLLQVGSTLIRLESREPRQIVEVMTEERPDEVVLDPGDMLLDLDPSNNRRTVIQ